MLAIPQQHGHAQPAQPTLDYNPSTQTFETRPQPPQTFPSAQLNAASQSAPQYPTSIRVRHHPQNTCRNIPVDQVDTIPFEEYVARVLPAELPTSWEPAALQAIAIRTYAWRQILANRADYDVSDWVDFQHMCNSRFPTTDAAVTATAGHYLSATSNPTHAPIVAMYSTENGHPTLTNPNVDYLQTVPDLYSLGQERFGHGYGLSQWGAQRRALAGHNHAEILAHYYTNVHLTSALQPEELQPEEMAARLIGFQAGDLLSANGFHWRTLLSTRHVASPTISIARATISETITHTNPIGDWQPTAPIQHQESITVSLHISNTIADQKNAALRHHSPTAPAISVPDAISTASLPITITTISSESIGIGQQWIWPGHTFTQTASSRMWQSPPTNPLRAEQSYRALITLHLKKDLPNIFTQSPLARLTVTDLDFTAPSGQTLLGLRELWQSDLFTDTQPTTIAVDFHLFNPPRGLTVNLQPLAEAHLETGTEIDFIIDQLQILRLPTPATAQKSTTNFPLHAAHGPTNIYAATFDATGNISQIVSQTVQVNDTAPPILGSIQQPAWHTSLPLTLTVPLTDTLSGIDLQSGELVISDQTGKLVFGAGALQTSLSTPENPWAIQNANTTIRNLADGRYTLNFAIADAAGNIVQSTAAPLQVDTTAPTIDLAPSITEPKTWHLTPISFTLTATDTTSGIDVITYTLNRGSTQRYVNPITNAGRNQLQAWATDIAGNQSKIVETEAILDLAAPTIQYSTRALGPSIIEIAWQAADDASGVSRVQLQRRISNQWQAVSLEDAEQIAGTIILEATGETSVQVRMRAIDQAGRRGAWQTQTIERPTSWHYFPIIRTIQNSRAINAKQ